MSTPDKSGFDHCIWTDRHLHAKETVPETDITIKGQHWTMAVMKIWKTWKSLNWLVAMSLVQI